MPIDKGASHSHKSFPPARTRTPKGGGGFRQAVPPEKRSLPPMDVPSTALLIDDIADERIAQSNRFSSLANRPISPPRPRIQLNTESSLRVTSPSAGLRNATSSTLTTVGSFNNNSPGKKNNFNKIVDDDQNTIFDEESTTLVGAFDSALDIDHRNEMAKRAALGVRETASQETMTADTSNKIEFESMSTYQKWTKDVVDPFLQELRKQLLIAKPDDVYGFTNQYCCRVAMGQPHPTKLGTMNRATGEGAVPGRRGSVINPGDSRKSMHRRYAQIKKSEPRGPSEPTIKESTTGGLFNPFPVDDEGK